MKKLLGAAVVAAALSFTGLISVSTANAAPPTATVSPGYDARLAASQSTDISSRRYYRRYGYYGGPRYYRPYRPYYAPRPYYRPYGYGGGYGYGGPGIRFGFY